MKSYIVRFFYGSDCRCEEIVKAPNTIAAIAIAESNIIDKYCPLSSGWLDTVDDGNFHIDIRVKV